MKKDIYDYSLEELQELPAADGFIEAALTYNEIIIVPTNEIHESGYQCMKYVLIENVLEKPFKVVGVFGGYSDVLHIDAVKANIDCLRNSKCIRLILHKTMATNGFVGSDFYADELSERWLKENEKA